MSKLLTFEETLVREQETIKNIIINRINFVLDNLNMFDKESFSVKYYIEELGRRYNTECPDIDIFIDNLQDSLYSNNCYRAYIIISLQDVVISFRPNTGYETLKKYCDNFIELAKKSNRFRFPKEEDIIELEKSGYINE